jgi:hypothetical protein
MIQVAVAQPAVWSVGEVVGVRGGLGSPLFS